MINDTKKGVPICKDCGQPMIEVGGTGKILQIGEYKDCGMVDGKQMQSWVETGVREQKLYQCPEDKKIALD